MVEIKDPYGFIYITTNEINGKRYIGQKRFEAKDNWKIYLGSGVTLQKAIKKYGRPNFIRDIVSIAYSKEELDNLEIEWITNYNAVESDDFYNIANGGHYGNSFAGKSKEEMIEIRRKIREGNKGREVWMKGKSHTEEAKNKNRQAHLGKKVSEETKEIWRRQRKGERNGMAITIRCVQTGEIFTCIKYAYEKYGEGYTERTFRNRVDNNKNINGFTFERI